jgi:ParB-like chromosome segregation protein Spo0J
MAAPAKRSSQASLPAPVALAAADLQVDAAIQPREFLTPDVIDEYATLYREVEDHEPLPPLEVFELDGAYYLADGFHRAAAAQKAQRPTVLCRVYQGTRQDAIRHAALANLKRGLPYSFADRTQVLERLLQDPEVGQRSDRQLAADLGLSHMTVYRARQRLAHIATLTQELEAQPITATTPAAKHQEQLASFLEVPVEQVALLAKHHQADPATVIRDIARTMADSGQSAPWAKRQEAQYLTGRAERQAREDAGRPPRPRATAEERATRRADNEREARYSELYSFLLTFEGMLPYTPTPEEAAKGDEPYTPKYSPAEMIAAADSYFVVKHTRGGPEDIVERLQNAYDVLDAFKAACIAQGWEVTF